MTTTNDQLAAQIAEQGRQIAVLQERVNTNASLAAEERQSVRAKIAHVERMIGEVKATAEKTDDTLTGFVNRVDGGKIVAQLGWKALTAIGAVAVAIWQVGPALVKIFVR